MDNSPWVHTHRTLSKNLNKMLLESKGSSWEEGGHTVLCLSLKKKKKHLKMYKSTLSEERKIFSSVIAVVY